MGTSRSDITFCFLVFSVSLLIATSCHGANHVALFIFGDSLYDAGNNKYIKDSLSPTFFPYGETFFKYPTGRCCDGRLIPDFIAQYANLPLIPPYLQPGNNQFINNGANSASKGVRVLVESLKGMLIGPKIQQHQQTSNNKLMNGVNFASAGAGALVETNPGMVIDLQTQLSYFKNVEKQLKQELGDTEANKLLSTAVYILSIGGNDYFQASTPNNNLEREEYVEMVIGNITTVIQEIHRKGGRKFGFSQLIPLGCLPAYRASNQGSTGGSGCLEEANLSAQLHNTALSKALNELEKQLEGFRYSNFDAYTAGIERINNPLKYGFKEVEKACCGSGPYGTSIGCGTEGYKLCDNVGEYFFFDSVHPTDFANSEFAKLMWSGNPDIVTPYNLKTLFDD